MEKPDTERDVFKDAQDPKIPEKPEGCFSNGSEIFRVGVRLPPFWPQEPAVWFAQVESQFTISGITTDATKFHYVLAQLEHQYAAEVKDLIVTPPATNKYDKLKSELIKRLSASREKAVKQLLIHEELGDRKPSQFMRHLQHLAGPAIPNEFLKTIWTSRLPRNIQTVIAAQPGTSLEALSDLADRIHEIVPPDSHVASTSANNGTLDELTKQISALTQQVAALTSQGSERSRLRTRINQRERSTSRSESSYRKFPTCWYHFKFGAKASRCVKPCDFKPENPKGGR